MGVFITAYQSRNTDEQITILDHTGANADVTSSDKVRIKVGRAGSAPILDVVSGTPLSGGTQVNAANPCTLKLYKADLASITPGIYDCEVGVVDASDSSRFKHAESGVFQLIGTQLGGTT